MVGTYGYYDKIPGLHTVSMGIESHSKLLRFVSNGYFNFPTHEARRGIYPKWGMDTKLAVKLDTCTFAVGSYYRDMVIAGRSYAYRMAEGSTPLQPHSLPVLGGVIEFACSLGFFRQFVRFTYDTVTKAEWSVGVSMGVSEYTSITRPTTLNGWTQTERYIGRSIATEMILPHQYHKNRTMVHNYTQVIQQKERARREQFTHQFITQALTDNKKSFSPEEAELAHYAVTGTKNSQAKTSLSQNLAVLRKFGDHLRLKYDVPLESDLYQERLESKAVLALNPMQLTPESTVRLLIGLYIPRSEILTRLTDLELMQETQLEAAEIEWRTVRRGTIKQ